MTHLDDLLSAANWPAPEIALDIASDEIERLMAGGCARDQGTTQYCAEAARMAARITELEEALKKIYEMGLCNQGGAYKTSFYTCFKIARLALGIPHMSFRDARAALEDKP